MPCYCFVPVHLICQRTIRLCKANKANGTWTMYSSLSDIGITFANETMPNIIANMTKPSMLSVHVNITVGNADIYPAAYGTLQVFKVSDARAIIWFFEEAVGAGRIWGGQYYQPTNTWGGWMRLSSAELPTEYMLPVSSGHTSNVRYCREDNGLVHIYGGLQINSGSIALDAVVAILPAGFRPSGNTAFPAAYYGSGGYAGGATLINTDGRIQARTPNVTSAYMYFGLSFLAAS